MLVTVSGGLDSAVLLHYLLNKCPMDHIHAVFFSYGQKAVNREFHHVLKVTEGLPVTLHRVDCGDIFGNSDSGLLAKGKSLNSGSASEQMREHGYINAVLPGRNGVLISAAIAVALHLGQGILAIGTHHTITMPGGFSDCSQEFINAKRAEAQAQGVDLITPFHYMNKKEIVKMALEDYKNDLRISDTWSCYSGYTEPCHTCSACTERENILKELGYEKN